MPTYAFICQQCGHAFEELVAMGKTAPCPRCQSARVNKQITAPAFNGGTSTAAASPTPRQGGGCGSGCGCH